MTADLVAVIATTFALVLLSIGMHFETLRMLSAWLPRSGVPRRMRVAFLIGVAVCAHLGEAIVFAFGIGLMIEAGYGTVAGDVSGAADIIYFSITSYTSLGYGDIAPQGPLRILCVVEALTGLVLIAWTASFTYVEMQKYWHVED